MPVSLGTAPYGTFDLDPGDTPTSLRSQDSFPGVTGYRDTLLPVPRVPSFTYGLLSTIKSHKKVYIIRSNRKVVEGSNFCYP